MKSKRTVTSPVRSSVLVLGICIRTIETDDDDGSGYVDDEARCRRGKCNKRHRVCLLLRVLGRVRASSGHSGIILLLVSVFFIVLSLSLSRFDISRGWAFPLRNHSRDRSRKPRKRTVATCSAFSSVSFIVPLSQYGRLSFPSFSSISLKLKVFN